MRAGLLEDHLIFAGDGDRLAELLKHARRLKRSCVVINPTIGGPLAISAQALGAAVVAGDPADPGAWRRAGLKRAASALILGLDDALAVASALAVAEAARNGRAEDAEPVDVICSVQDADLRSLVEGAFHGRIPLPSAALQTNSPAEIQARRLIQRHPLYRGADVEAGEQIRALIVGFGRVGEEISLQILKTGMVDEAIAPSVTVIDHRQGQGSRRPSRHRRHARPGRPHGAAAAPHRAHAEANPGVPWRLVLDGDVASLLADWPDPSARDKARWLINNADQVLGPPVAG